ncbi:LD-carboxypeptidase [Kitasatospora sp. NPDC058170]|uniref:S66 peptidase family protein n=1 Tax=Kitasatospora sp. NPDC058170 TaxID=3346364 RepID=UPI0036D81B5B
MPESPATVRPPALRPGDTIAVVSPACPATAFLVEEVRRGTEALERMGFTVRMMPHAKGVRGWTSGSVQERLDDLHQAFADPTVHAVLYSIGGLHSAQLLSGLDMELIAANPKVFCGYSDATSLLSAVHTATGLVTFYGPALIPQFGELAEPYPETAEHFLRVVREPAPAGPLPRIPYQVVDLDYARREREQRPRDRTPAPARGVLRPGPGTASGPALAVCLPSVRDLIGTPWQPDTTGRVLFVETPEPPYSPATADADLWHLRNAGLLDDVAAVVLGRPLGWDATEVEAFTEAVAECLDGLAVPVLTDVEFGHTNPILTLPNGVHVAVDGTELTLLEPAVG